MNVRKYIVSDMQEGFDRIRRELGRDAVILNQRTVKEKGLAGWFSKPRLEIYVAYDDAPARVVPISAAAPAPAPVVACSPAPVPFVACPPAPVPVVACPPEPAVPPPQSARPLQPLPATAPATRPDSLASRLLAVDVHPEVVAQLTAQAQHAALGSGEDTRRILHRLIMERLDAAPGLQPVAGARRLALFAGPAGVGKTTAVLKLAADLCGQPGTGIGLLSADFSRAGAHVQLVALGRLLRVPVAVIQSISEAPAALDQLRNCALVLIDTAGCNPLDSVQRLRLQELAAHFQPDETFLCLSAATAYTACRRMLEQFRFLDGYRLIITKTDEVPESGAVLNISSLAGRPPAYLTSGQQIPGQIQACDARLLADRMMG